MVSLLHFVLSSKCVETIYLPGTITRPNTCGSSMTPLPSGFKYSLQDTRMTFPSPSVQRKIPIRTRPSVISNLKFLFSQPHNFCFPGVAGLEVVFFGLSSLSTSPPTADSASDARSRILNVNPRTVEPVDSRYTD